VPTSLAYVLLGQTECCHALYMVQLNASIQRADHLRLLPIGGIHSCSCFLATASYPAVVLGRHLVRLQPLGEGSCCLGHLIGHSTCTACCVGAWHCCLLGRMNWRAYRQRLKKQSWQSSRPPSDQLCCSSAARVTSTSKLYTD
jgi:hypothetical protein